MISRLFSCCRTFPLRIHHLNPPATSSWMTALPTMLYRNASTGASIEPVKTPEPPTDDKQDTPIPYSTSKASAMRVLVWIHVGGRLIDWFAWSAENFLSCSKSFKFPLCVWFGKLWTGKNFMRLFFFIWAGLWRGRRQAKIRALHYLSEHRRFSHLFRDPSGGKRCGPRDAQATMGKNSRPGTADTRSVDWAQ